MRKTILVIISLLILFGAAFYFFLYPMLEIVSGYNAKNMCSCQFVSGLKKDRIEKEDLGFTILWMASNEIDTINKTVHSSVWGMQPKVAVYREGLGCSIIKNENDKTFLSRKVSISPNTYAPEIFPEGNVTGSPAMQQAIDAAFDQNDSEPLVRTRAVVVIKDGKLIGERYAGGIDRNTPLLGWSMTKSVTAALTGILVKNDFWRVEDPLPVDSWKNDDRKNISLKNALQQTVGLKWEEVYSSVSSATKMLYEKGDMGKYAASLPLEYEPGTHWKYSSGTTNIIANVMEKAFSSNQEYLEFPQVALFGPIGARDFIIETDASNHFVGSSYGYAPARSWAKVGMLYLNKGNWFGNQIIDSSWVAASVVAVPESHGEYGYQFWLNQGGKYENYSRNAYWMNGYQAQQVAIHPEENMVIVRLGVTYDQTDFDFDGWTKKIIEAAKTSNRAEETTRVRLPEATRVSLSE